MRRGMKSAIQSRGRGSNPKEDMATIGSGRVSAGKAAPAKRGSAAGSKMPVGKAAGPKMGTVTERGKRYKAEPVKPRTKAYAKGGKVRGTGCATKGTRPAKTY